MDTIEEAVLPGRRRRRSYSADFRAQVVQACQGPGVSIASVALANGMNANLLRRWVTDRERTQALQSVKTQRPVQTMAGQFVPVALSRPELELEPIRIEIRKGSVSIAMSLPAALVKESGALLRELLK
jgi:transposase